MNVKDPGQYVPAPPGAYETKSKDTLRWKITKRASDLPEDESAKIINRFTNERKELYLLEDKELRLDAEIPPRHTYTMIRHYRSSRGRIAVIQHTWMPEALICMPEEVTETG